jgi:hypothetical protein
MKLVRRDRLAAAVVIGFVVVAVPLIGSLAALATRLLTGGEAPSARSSPMVTSHATSGSPVGVAALVVANVAVAVVVAVAVLRRRRALIRRSRTRSITARSKGRLDRVGSPGLTRTVSVEASVPPLQQRDSGRC